MVYSSSKESYSHKHYLLVIVFVNQAMSQLLGHFTKEPVFCIFILSYFFKYYEYKLVITTLVRKIYWQEQTAQQ